MTIELSWEEPPPKSRTGKYAGVLDELQAKQGCWARFATFETARGAAGLAASLRKANPGFDFVSRGTSVYGVFTGIVEP